MDKKVKELSKFLSLILRHKPEVIGIKLDEHGWANVRELYIFLLNARFAEKYAII